MQNYFETRIEFLKGVGPARAELLNKELSIFTFGDLIQHYPFRYEDRTKFYQISELHEQSPNVQIRGTLRHVEMTGQMRKKRLHAVIADETGELELVWFKGHQWVMKKLQVGQQYIVYGKPNRFNYKMNMAHPEIELLTEAASSHNLLQPVYSTTEKLRLRSLDSRGIYRLIQAMLAQALPHVRETLPAILMKQYKLCGKQEAIAHIHIPPHYDALAKAEYRLKFEEFFYIQLRLLKMKVGRADKFKGQTFRDSTLLAKFYNEHLPFELTTAQKRVIKEIYRDLRSGVQMNRLVQGDVGSGKTIVSFICMLIAIGSGAQVAFMAPTEILADQHFHSLKPFAEKLNLHIAVLKGATKTKERKQIHAALESGELNILVGTHALLEDKVQFQNLGLAITDEQHRFGVAQRAKLWQKNQDYMPHILVMTATPIPRTLAMTLYGDLDISAIDELPAGRKEIQTLHKFESHRSWVFGFLKKQIDLGRQVYIVYPLIEESAKLDLKHLTDGYEAICRAFPGVPIGVLHGRMKARDKEFEMQRFVKNETKILVATTVIEVGVNVPNATVMVIENAERFGLAQLHQLRGRVGRGADQSYCLLMTDYKLSKESKMRLETMVRTNNGFEIAEADMKQRGPGDLMGTQQSGLMDMLIGDISRDGKVLELARHAAKDVLDSDPQLDDEKHLAIRQQIDSAKKNVVNWSRIS
jgi:ATP-dependent DNA helicase RecG